MVSQHPLLRSGPMVGHVDMMEANIWVQLHDTATVRIEYQDVSGEGRRQQTSSKQAQRDNAYCVTMTCDSVQPGRSYTYWVYINDLPVDFPYPTTFTTRPLFRWRADDWPTATIMIGSCFYINEEGFERWNKDGVEVGYGSQYEIVTAMQRTPSDVMVWLGDNVYLREADWNSRSGILHRFSHTREVSELQPFLASRSHYAIWDDHDFGPNNSNRSFWAKDIALEAHKLFWPAPSYGVGGLPGITTTFEIADVQVFLLDDRYYRTPEHRVDVEPSILGEHQIQWLVDALVSSTATFKIIAVGSQFLATDSRKEGFIHAPAERQQLIDLITKNDIKGVLFVSGDVHGAELMKMDRTNAYPLYEFTSSALTAGSNVGIADQPNDHRIQGTAYGLHNFGTITVSGPRKERSLTLRLMSKDGEEIWQRTITADELR